MKQEVKPATIAVAVVIVIMLIAVIGMKVFSKPSGPKGPPPAEAQKWQAGSTEQMQQHFTNPGQQQMPGR